MESLQIDQYLPGRLRYEWRPGHRAFGHNLARDLHCFVLWESARRREEYLIEAIAQEFLILQRYEVTWSKHHVASNFNRLYGRDPFKTESRHEKVGAGPFLLLIVEDPEPAYVYWRNVSGRVELTNRKITYLKPKLRASVDNGFSYNVHSSNSVEEFFRDACLILGPREFSRCIEAGFPHKEMTSDWQEDLAGAVGWQSIEELFSALAYSQRFAILRSLEDAMRPIAASQGDIDLVCDDASFLRSEMNGRQVSVHQYVTRVAESEVMFDLREIGDYDLDKAWQDSILRNVDDSQFPFLVPDMSDRFFYLLYHVKIQKGYMKPEHERFLENVSQDLGLPLDAGWTADDVAAAKILNGFLWASSYEAIVSEWPAVKSQQHTFLSLLDGSVVRQKNGDSTCEVATRGWTYRLRRHIRRIPFVGPSLALCWKLIRGRLTRRNLP